MVKNLLQTCLEIHLIIWYKGDALPEFGPDIEDGYESHGQVVRNECVRGPVTFQEDGPTTELRMVDRDEEKRWT